MSRAERHFPQAIATCQSSRYRTVCPCRGPGAGGQGGQVPVLKVFCRQKARWSMCSFNSRLPQPLLNRLPGIAQPELVRPRFDIGDIQGTPLNADDAGDVPQVFFGTALLVV